MGLCRWMVEQGILKGEILPLATKKSRLCRAMNTQVQKGNCTLKQKEFSSYNVIFW